MARNQIGSVHFPTMHYSSCFFLQYSEEEHSSLLLLAGDRFTVCVFWSQEREHSINLHFLFYVYLLFIYLAALSCGMQNLLVVACGI